MLRLCTKTYIEIKEKVNHKKTYSFIVNNLLKGEYLVGEQNYSAENGQIPTLKTLDLNSMYHFALPCPPQPGAKYLKWVTSCGNTEIPCTKK